MIEVAKRRLNPRYYTSSGTAKMHVNFQYDVQSAALNEGPLIQWIRNVEKAGYAFEQIPCEGSITATVIRGIPGYSVIGHIYVFDQQSQESIQPVVLNMFDVLQNNPSDAGSFKATFSITIRTLAFRLNTEGVFVPFCEFDTEPIEKPTHTSVVTHGDPSRN